MSEPSGANRRKKMIFVGLGAVALLLAAFGAFAWQRSRPMFDPGEVHAARARLERERRELLAMTCARTAIGDAAPTNQEAFDDLVFGARWAECRRLASAEGLDMVTNEAGHSFDWTLDRGDGHVTTPPVENARYMRTHGPPARSAEIDAAEAACEGLDEEVARLAATTDLCTPARPAPSGWDPDPNYLPMIQIAKVVGLRARRLAREGSTFEGMQLLLQGLAVIRDLRRGPAHLLVAMSSVAAEGILLSHAVTLLLADPELSATAVDTLDATLLTLLGDEIPQHVLWRAERNATADVVPLNDEARDLMVMSASAMDLSWCPEGAGAEACLAALRERSADAGALPPEWRLVLLGPRSNRAEMIRWSQEQLLQTYDTYLARLLVADSNLALLRAALAWARARTSAESCPPTLPEDRLHVTTSDDPIEIVPYDGDTFEMRAPALRAWPGAERTVVYLACPASGVGWFDADGEPVPSAASDPAADGPS